MYLLPLEPQCLSGFFFQNLGIPKRSTTLPTPIPFLIRGLLWWRVIGTAAMTRILKNPFILSRAVTINPESLSTKAVFHQRGTCVYTGWEASMQWTVASEKMHYSELACRIKVCSRGSRRKLVLTIETQRFGRKS
jgi:hypothetical protein